MTSLLVPRHARSVPTAEPLGLGFPVCIMRGTSVPGLPPGRTDNDTSVVTAAVLTTATERGLAGSAQHVSRPSAHPLLTSLPESVAVITPTFQVERLRR